MTTREAIAAAATITDVTDVSPTARQNPTPGQGSVRLDRRLRDGSGFGWLDVWQVIIFLPQTIPAAETWLEAHLTDVMDALGSELYVTAATPSTIVLDTGTVPGVIIEGSREHN